jgi:hypothetical protein
MAPIQYIAVPVGTAGGPEWRGVIARYSDQGYKIFWCASVLAELAARADQGGLLAYSSGQPKSVLDLCAELGVEAVWAAETLFPALERLGEGYWQEDGAWVCTSPMIRRTLEWREDQAAKVLPAASKRQERPLILMLVGEPPGGETKAARNKRLGRNRKRVADYRAKWGGDPDHIEYSVTPSVTVPLLGDGNAEITATQQVNDNNGIISALPAANINEVEVIKTSSYTPVTVDDEDTETDIRQVLIDVPASKRVKVGNSVRKALAAGHPLYVAHQAIDSARREASSGRPWVGLALHKLGELAKPESLLPAQPAKPSSNYVEEVPSEPVVASDTETEEAFRQAMSNPDTPLYKEMYARITDFAREMGEGNDAFVRNMRDVFCALTLQLQGLPASPG